KRSRWLVKERGVDLPLADWRSIRELRAAGMEVGSHGMTHSRLTEFSPDACREELLESRKLMEDRLGHEVRYLAYPFGYLNDRVRAQAKEIGYLSACSVRIGFSSLLDDVLALRRIPVNGNETLPDFICRLRTARSVAEYFGNSARGVWGRLPKQIGVSS